MEMQSWRSSMKRLKQIALKLKAAAWNFQAVTDELLNIIEIAERDEALERLNGGAVKDDSSGDE